MCGGAVLPSVPQPKGWRLRGGWGGMGWVGGGGVQFGFMSHQS